MFSTWAGLIDRWYELWQWESLRQEALRRRVLWHVMFV